MRENLHEVRPKKLFTMKTKLQLISQLERKNIKIYK